MTMLQNIEKSSTSKPLTVFLCGCGVSILDLKNEEKEQINKAKFSIGINGFTEFSYKVGIFPKTTWMTDTTPLCAPALTNIISTTLKTNPHIREFILPKVMVEKTKKHSKIGVFNRFFPWRNRAWTFHSNRLSYRLHWLFKNIPIFSYLYRITYPFYLPKNIKKVFVHRNNVVENKGGAWAEKPSECLYSFQSSLTSIFNYVYLNFPNSNIVMAGVDLNSKGYFFANFSEAKEVLSILRKELKELKSLFKNKENCQEIEINGNHASLVNYNGQGTILDVMDFIIKKLEEKNIRLYSMNPKSELVLRGWAGVWNG